MTYFRNVVFIAAICGLLAGVVMTALQAYATVPLILEARGLDVTPSMRDKLRELGDEASARIFDVIYNDEKGHVAVGAKWFRFLCARERRDPAAAFQELVRANFRGGLKAPFNDLARAEAGLTPGFYRSLSPISNA